MPGTLVIRLKGMGDIVHVIPALKILRENRPYESLGFLCMKPFGSLIPRNLGVEIFQIAPGAAFGETLSLLRKIRKRKFDRLIDFFCNPRTSLISILSGIPMRAGFDYRIRRWAYHKLFIPKDSNRHLSELFGEFLEFLGMGGKIEHPHLEISENDREWANEFVRKHDARFPLLGVNPHASYPSKAWPTEYFEAFIKAWNEATKKPALVFWGPGEYQKTARLLESIGERGCFTHPPLTLSQLIALISKTNLFLTADTGPMNIAWALKVPTVALFGPTTRRAVAPRGDRHLVLFNEELGCLQCHKEVCSDGKCMKSLTPDFVFRKTKEKYVEFFK